MAMEEAAVSVSTEVRLISTSTVRHSRLIEEPQRRCHLTPWDLNLLSIHYIQKGLLFPFSSSHHHHHHVADGADEDEKMKHEEEPIIPHLIRSLAATLDYFYPLAGRLATIKHGGDGGDVDGNSSTTTSIFIDCNNEGAEFIHAAAAGTITVSDVLAPGFTPRAVRSFFPLNGAVNHDGHSLPLLSVQATELRDGIFLAVSMNHAAADGNSFWHFVNSWAEIARGGPKPDATAAAAISRIPVLHRWIPEPHRAPLRLPPISGDLIKRPPQFPELEDVVFHFSPEALSALKSAANDEMGNSIAGTGGGQISSLQSLLAFVWKAVTRARRLNPDQVTTYRIAVGFRQRIQPPLPANYFGNAVLVAKVEARAGEVLGWGIGRLAWEFHRSIAIETDTAARSWLEAWVGAPSFTYLDGSWRWDLFTGSSPRFDVYGGNDFGWGTPVAVRSGVGNKFDGKLTIFPGRSERSVALEMCLHPEVLRALMADEEFTTVATLESL